MCVVCVRVCAVLYLCVLSLPLYSLLLQLKMTLILIGQMSSQNCHVFLSLRGHFGPHISALSKCCVCLCVCAGKRHGVRLSHNPFSYASCRFEPPPDCPHFQVTFDVTFDLPAIGGSSSLMATAKWGVKTKIPVQMQLADRIKLILMTSKLKPADTLEAR